MFDALGARLAAVARLIPLGHSVADIGTDHGRLPAWLLRTKRATRVIAADIEAAPLAGARSRLAGTSADLRQGDGIQVLRPGEVQTVVLSGMGGRSMIRILQAPSEVLGSLRRLVLQPQREADAIRRWLVAREWSLVEEEQVEERGRFYTVMAWEPGAGDRVWTERDFRFGPLVLERGGPVTRAWLEDELQHADQNLRDLDLRSPGHARRDELLGRVQSLREALSCVSVEDATT